MAAQDYMYFLVDSMNMTKENIKSPLEGEVLAKHIYVNMSGNEFEIQTGDDEFFTADAILESNRFTFIKDGMKFSTPLEDNNPLYSIDRLNAQKAEIEMSHMVIDVKGDDLGVHLGPIDFQVNNINMQCKVNEFTTAIDEACIQNTLIKPFDPSKISSIKVSDLSEEQAYKLDIETNLLSIIEDNLFIEVKNIKGNYLDNNFGISRGELNCFKDPELRVIDVENIVYGCLKKSKIIGERLKYKIPSFNIHVNKASLSFDKNNMKLFADYASFKTGSAVTYAAGMTLECDKDPIVVDINNPNAILTGCMRSTVFKLEKMDNGTNKKSQMKDIKNFKLSITNGNFRLTGKVKLLFYLSLDIKGKVRHVPAKKQIIIDVNKAKVGKISAKNFTLNIVRKFINGDNVKVVDNSIIIQL
jgi:hypothetical protein